jgi:gamma-glutamyltranspeptidase/glutathione hydrolase
MVLKDKQIRYALGLPGGLRIFPSALQAVINLIDHGMSLQQAVEAPRVWTQGFELELEPAFPAPVQADLEQRGHPVLRVPNVGGGMNAIAFHEDGMLEGAACWRADGTPVGLGGGLARNGVRFLPETRKP